MQKLSLSKFVAFLSSKVSKDVILKKGVCSLLVAVFCGSLAGGSYAFNQYLEKNDSLDNVVVQTESTEIKLAMKETEEDVINTEIETEISTESTEVSEQSVSSDYVADDSTSTTNTEESLVDYYNRLYGNKVGCYFAQLTPGTRVYVPDMWVSFAGQQELSCGHWISMDADGNISIWAPGATEDEMYYADPPGKWTTENLINVVYSEDERHMYSNYFWDYLEYYYYHETDVEPVNTTGATFAVQECATEEEAAVLHKALLLQGAYVETVEVYHNEDGSTQIVVLSMNKYI